MYGMSSRWGGNGEIEKMCDWCCEGVEGMWSSGNEVGVMR